MLVLAWVAVETIEQKEVAKAQQAGGGKADPPAEAIHHDAYERCTEGGSEFRRRVKDRRRQATFFQRKPVARRLRVGREGRRLTYAQQQTRRKKARHPRRNRCEKRRNTPD